MDEQILAALNKRYATKKFDQRKKIPSQHVDTILEAVRLTPTSYGLQLMKIVVVENESTRAKLVPHSYGQEQVIEASHLLILCREKEVDQSHISAYISNIASTRNTSEITLDGFKNMMTNSILGMSEESRKIWMNKQVYIALGNLLTICALLEIDACPMEGFDSDEYDRILELPEKNLNAVLAIPIGYRSEDDSNAGHKKVRRSTSDFIIKI